MSPSQYVLTLACPNRPGIVAAISAVIFEHGGDIREAQQYGNLESNRFFARMVFDHPGASADVERLKSAFDSATRRFDMDWSVRDRSDRQRVMLMVSKFDHCLADILYRWRNGELPMDVTAIVSNHPRSTYQHHDFGEIPFHHLPVTKSTKSLTQKPTIARVS